MSSCEGQFLVIEIKRQSPSINWGLELVGGIDTRMELEVSSVKINSPCHFAGLETNDRILEVNGKKFNILPHNQVVEYFAGSQDLSISVLVQRPNKLDDKSDLVDFEEQMKKTLIVGSRFNRGPKPFGEPRKSLNVRMTKDDVIYRKTNTKPTNERYCENQFSNQMETERQQQNYSGSTLPKNEYSVATKSETKSLTEIKSSSLSQQRTETQQQHYSSSTTPKTSETLENFSINSENKPSIEKQFSTPRRHYSSSTTPKTSETLETFVIKPENKSSIERQFSTPRQHYSSSTTPKISETLETFVIKPENRFSTETELSTPMRQNEKNQPIGSSVNYERQFPGLGRSEDDHPHTIMMKNLEEQLKYGEESKLTDSGKGTYSKIMKNIKSGSLSRENCYSCCQPLFGSVIRARNYKFHENCFNCSVCKTSLGLNAFFWVNESLMCLKDAEKVLGSNYDYITYKTE